MSHSTPASRAAQRRRMSRAAMFSFVRGAAAALGAAAVSAFTYWVQQR